MASPRQPDVPRPDDPAEPAAVPYDTEESGDSGPEPPKIIRLRVAAWDVICAVVLLALLIVLATATSWPSRLYGFLADVCSDETCGPVPFAIDMYIYPLVWGGVGAAVAAAVIGPFVSLLKGWYLSFWPVLALAILVISSVAASTITIFSQRYWH